MWHRVAALLHRTVPEAQATLSSAEFVEWCAFYSLEPWGWHADAWRMGVLAATTANYSGRVKRPLKPADFLPTANPKKRKRQISDGELHARLKADVERASNESRSQSPDQRRRIESPTGGGQGEVGPRHARDGRE